MISFTHMPTRSIPIVSCLSSINAIFSFVPTPSVELTRTGFLVLWTFNEKSPANPPMPVMTPDLKVLLTIGFKSSTNRLPASMSTPASVYLFFF